MIMTDNSEQTDVIASALDGLGELATLPEVTIRVIELVDDPRSDASELHDIIRHDPALAARVLRVVNSAFYGLPAEIGCLERAIVLLGLAAIKNIAVSASMSRVYRTGAGTDGPSGRELWHHAIADAVAARLLAPIDREEYFLTGLITDLGLLVERQLFGEEWAGLVARFRATGACFCELERAAFGADHHAFGMALAKKWKFPERICEAIGHCHNPFVLKEPFRRRAGVVHVADILACRANLGFCTLPPGMEVSVPLLEAAGLTFEQIETVAQQLPGQVALADRLFSCTGE